MTEVARAVNQQESCAKWKYLDQAESLVITVHELLLPRDKDEARSMTLLLQISKPFRCPLYLLAK